MGFILLSPLLAEWFRRSYFTSPEFPLNATGMGFGLGDHFKVPASL